MTGLLPVPKNPRLRPMTVAAAWAWLASYNAYAARMRAYEDQCQASHNAHVARLRGHEDHCGPAPLEQPSWAEGSHFHDFATPKSCIGFSVQPYRRPLGYIRLSGSFDATVLHRPPHADPAMIVWAGWRQHPGWDGTEPMPGAVGHFVQQPGGRRLLSFA